MSSQKDDVEEGSNLLYPLMQENPELRWAFIRKVYSILTLQLLATTGFAALVVCAHPIASFFYKTWIGLVVYAVLILVPIFIVVCLLYIFRMIHPINFILLGMLTMLYGLALGVVCFSVSSKVVLETAIATTVVVVSLTLYTFWAAKRGQDFGFLIPLLACILPVFLTYTIFQIFFPMGKISQVIYSGLFVIIFSVYMICDTETLIKRHTYDEYIWASVLLYLDVVRIFVGMLDIFKATSE